MLSKKLAVALGTGIFALGAATSAHAATISVQSDADSGPGTLRDAIDEANLFSNRDTIKFKIPGSGVHTITPVTQLPDLNYPVKIDGYTQGDADPATDSAPAKIEIVLDASNVREGLLSQADNVEIRGLDVQHALLAGIMIDDANNNVVAGNYVGTGVNGGAAKGNDSEGVRVSGDNNVVGGPHAEDRNVIAGSDFADVLVESGAGNTVQNNHIGTDVDGRSDLGDARGVQLASSGNNVSDNLVSGESTGIEIAADDNVVQGNKIGTDEAGAVALPNVVGVSVIGGDDNVVQDNLLSGNEKNAVELKRFSTSDPAERNKIEGNRVGTTDAGDDPLPNGEAGVSVSGSDNNTIGGTAAEAGNVISGNEGDGVELVDADNNKVLGNRIGTDSTGALDLGNDGSGVDIDGLNNRVGDTTGTLAPNTIAHNGEDGVTVAGGTGNAVLRNSIHNNGSRPTDDLAVDLSADGTTGNDPGDGDSGPNDLQNGAEIDSASATQVEWSLDSDATTRYRLEFYANDTCSGASVTEAQTFLGATTVTTDANGEADDGDDGVPGTPIALPAGAGQFISMTATRMERVVTKLIPLTFSLEPRSTSEVSPCEEIS